MQSQSSNLKRNKMKQTAVEWFYNGLKKLIKESELTDMKPSEFDARESKLINQAKKLEKQQQQQGYNEEEVIWALLLCSNKKFKNSLEAKEWWNNFKRK
jgi:hypothetical protein